MSSLIREIFIFTARFPAGPGRRECLRSSGHALVLSFGIRGEASAA